MKAALYQGQGQIELTILPDPECTPEGAVLENVYASICGTDVAVYKYGTGLGHRITIGGEFGHEVFCRIKETGSKVLDFKPGDRVYPYPRTVTGDPHRAGTIGGFSEYIHAPAARFVSWIVRSGYRNCCTLPGPAMWLRVWSTAPETRQLFHTR